MVVNVDVGVHVVIVIVCVVVDVVSGVVAFIGLCWWCVCVEVVVVCHCGRCRC